MTLSQNIISNILGPHPKKEINVKNNRTKRWPKRSDSTVSRDDSDAKQGLAKESERED